MAAEKVVRKELELAWGESWSRLQLAGAPGQVRAFPSPPAQTPTQQYPPNQQVVEPKIYKLHESEAELKVATRERTAVEEELAVVQAKLDEMQAHFDAAMAQKQVRAVLGGRVSSAVVKGGGGWDTAELLGG